MKITDNHLRINVRPLWSTLGVLLVAGLSIGSLSLPIPEVTYRGIRRVIFGDLNTYLGYLLIAMAVTWLSFWFDYWIANDKRNAWTLFQFANMFNFVYLAGLTTGRWFLNLEPPVFRAVTADVFVAAMMLAGLLSTISVLRQVRRAPTDQPR